MNCLRSFWIRLKRTLGIAVNVCVVAEEAGMRSIRHLSTSIRNNSPEKPIHEIRKLSNGSIDFKDALHTSYFDRKTSLSNNLGQFGHLKSTVRKTIYEYLTPNDILQLRITSKSFLKDVSLLRGVKLTMDFHNSWEQFKFASTNGVESIQFLTLAPLPKNLTQILKYPDLLKELIIKAAVSSKILTYFLENCSELQTLNLDFKSDTIHLQLEEFLTGTVELPGQLKQLRIAYTVTDKTDSAEDINSLILLLSSVNCPELQSFTFEIADVSAANEADRLHLAAFDLVKGHVSSLRRINIKIIHLDPTETVKLKPSLFSLNQTRDSNDNDSDNEESDDENEHNISEGNDWIENLELTCIELEMDFYWNEWSPLVKAQANLEKLALSIQMEDVKWPQLIPIISTQLATLKIIEISNISLPHESRKLDLKVFEDCEYLEELILRHREEYDSKHVPPTLAHMEALSKTLKLLCLNYFVLRYQQELLILVHLPKLERLELGYWTTMNSRETSLPDFLGVLGPLIIQKVTHVQVFVLKGLKSQFTNAKEAIDEFAETISQNFNVIQDDLDEYDEGWTIVQPNYRELDYVLSQISISKSSVLS